MISDAIALNVLNFLAKKNGFAYWFLHATSKGVNLMMIDIYHTELTIFYRLESDVTAKQMVFPLSATYEDVVKQMFDLSMQGANIYAASSSSYCIWRLIPPFKNLEEILVEMDLEQELV